MATQSWCLILILVFHQTLGEDGYLRFVKDGCFIRGEALNCIKYKALKLAKKTLFGSGNETIRANQMISFVPLEESSIANYTVDDSTQGMVEPRGLVSEWTELTKYGLKMVKDFFRMKGLRVNLPEGARAIEDDDEGRSKKKRLAIIVPFLTLVAALKAKLLLIPILLAVLLIKKLLLLAALLIPSLLHTLKVCKVHHPMHHSSYFGSSDASDFSTGYAANSYASGAGYSKDWASNRAYSMPKMRPTQPVYITAPGAATS